MIAGKRKHMLGRNLAPIAIVSDRDAICGDLQDARIQVRRYLAFLEAIFDIRPNPILHRLAQFGSPMHQ